MFTHEAGNRVTTATATLDIAGFPLEVSGTAAAVEIARRRFQPPFTRLRGVEPLRAAVRCEGATICVSVDGREAYIDAATHAARVPEDLAVVDSALRVALSRAVLARGGLLLHAAALATPAGAVVCFGASGSGKSTIAAALGPSLSDELVVIEPASGGFQARGTPWWRGTGGTAPVVALVWLVRGEAPGVRRSVGAELCRALLGEAAAFVDRTDDHVRSAEACIALGALGCTRVAAAEGDIVQAVKAVLP